jgi:hypothetical protein
MLKTARPDGAKTTTRSDLPLFNNLSKFSIQIVNLFVYCPVRGYLFLDITAKQFQSSVGTA